MSDDHDVVIVRIRMSGEMQAALIERAIRNERQLAQQARHYIKQGLERDAATEVAGKQVV